jgi:CDP-diglyceride synthetase
MLVAVVAGAIGGLLSSAATGVLVGVWFWHNPQTMSAIQGSGGLGEAFIGVPLLLIPLSLISGTFGAIGAKGLSFHSRHRGRAF